MRRRFIAKYTCVAGAGAGVDDDEVFSSDPPTTDASPASNDVDEDDDDADNGSYLDARGLNALGGFARDVALDNVLERSEPPNDFSQVELLPPTQCLVVALQRTDENDVDSHALHCTMPSISVALSSIL